MIGEAREGDEQPGEERWIDVAEGSGGIEVRAHVQSAGAGEEFGEVAEFVVVDGSSGGVTTPQCDAKKNCCGEEAGKAGA